ncbi:MAG: ABC transporter ATP-binding protein [bacterium]|nr:ABC transporter ATP-binding protein [bacterium]
MISAVEISNLKKNYGKVLALRDVGLKIPQGEFFGLLGPNGAGKSTLINCIVGLAKPSHGEVKVFGHSVRKNPIQAKTAIGFSPQEVNVERFFNLRRTLEFQGGFYGFPPKVAARRAQELLEQFGLADRASEQFSRLSGGMQKRLLIARAMMSRPKLLILDEPTAGVDVAQRHDLWAYLRGLNRDGTSIILTTHYIDEAETLCERVGIINHGRILELGSPAELIQKYGESKVCVSVEGKLEAEEFSSIPNFHLEDQQITVKTTALGATTEKIMAILTSKPGRRVRDISVSKGNLEEAFLKVTGRTMREEAGEELPHPAIPMPTQ